MAKKVTVKKLSVRDKYPNHPYNHDQKPASQRVGNKVRWETFATREEAEKCAAWALQEAQIKFEMGYDAGYCSPGSITEKDGKFEVCIL